MFLRTDEPEQSDPIQLNVLGMAGALLLAACAGAGLGMIDGEPDVLPEGEQIAVR